MLLSDVLAIVFSVLGVLLSFQGLWLLGRSVFPAAVAAIADDCERTLWKPFLAGLPIAAAVVIGVGRLFKIGGPGGLAGIVILSLFILITSVGVAGLCCLLGQRLNNGQRSVRTMVLGGVALELAYVFPIAGWFFVLPLTLVIGCGATCRYAFTKIRGTKSAVQLAPARSSATSCSDVPDALTSGGTSK